MQDSQAHESDVFHHDRGLYIDRHEEQTESYKDKKTGWKVRLNVSHLSTNHNQITGLMVDM